MHQPQRLFATNRPIDSAEACRRLALLRHHAQSEADIAAEHGLSPVSFAIYQLLNGRLEESGTDSAMHEKQTPHWAHFDEGIKRIARGVESVVNRHNAVVDWQSNLEVLREMRRDIKRELRPTDDYTEEQLEELANRIVDLARRRSRQ